MMGLIRKYTPEAVIASYHKAMAIFANIYYGRPSEKLIVIGVTGTNGKTTTVSLIAKVLEEAGFKVGAASTAIFKIADKEWLNDKKMTMLGRFALQKLLSDMVNAGCQYAVIETSSQGIEQFRHVGIHYDVCVFTNLTPEHIEAHKGFENYKKAKLKLFKKLEGERNKEIRNIEINKAIIANGNDIFAKEFLDFNVSQKIVYGIGDVKKQFPISNFLFLAAQNIKYLTDGVSFDANDINYKLKLFGRFNVYNSLAAIAVGLSQSIPFEILKAALEHVSVMPGRMEFIENDKNFKIIVDYAPEPESMRQLFETIKLHKLVVQGGKIIHVFGSCGGGRDTARRPVLGQISAENGTIAIITNEDPYDDEPGLIIDQVAQGAISGGLVEGQNLFKIGDRREAVRKALSLARPGDLVLLTGKGSEQAICSVGGKKIPWDERQVVREELKKLAT
ncbi:MAG: UDP-N-acetylmuramoyl-L-alanyl-D-glutamate--2,6-diaminopimelate ligase [Candidatus Buchananbacteria bacterium]